MNFTFDNPVYLWYFVSIPLLVITHFLSLRSAKRKAMRFANFKTLKRISGENLLTKNMGLLIMRIIILSLLLLSISGTKLWYETERTDNNYVIAIDVSSSMSSKDISPSRLEKAKEYAQALVSTIESDAKIGIVTFSGVTIIEQTLTTDHNYAQAAIDAIQTEKAGGTDVPGSVITGTNLLLADSKRGRVMIILTDGSNTLGNYIDRSLDRALNYAKENHVTVHAIGIGSETGPIGYLPEYYNISATYNEEVLTQITNSTGGILIQSFNEEDISNSFVDLMGKRDKAQAKLSLDYITLIAAIILLFVEWGLVNSRYRRNV